MAKNSTTERGGRDSFGVQRISTVDNPNQGGPRLFMAALGLILVAGVAAVVYFASTRESNIGVAPLASVDHWHSAYLINNCGVDLPATGQFENPAGLHTHGDGLLHLHPFNPSAAGKNATLGQYFAGADAVLTDESFTTGFSDVLPATMSEADGCDGEAAVLQLAVWPNAFDETSEPKIITENIADFRFTSAGMAITLALLPEGSDIPRPPADRIAALAETGAGGPIEGVEPGESPFVTTSTQPPVTDDAGDGADDAPAADDGQGTVT
ncbi:MAG: hypothetical protein WBM50_09475, partial [Acidimicrobiales bacterium]